MFSPRSVNAVRFARIIVRFKAFSSSCAARRDVFEKYADKLQKRADVEGKTLDELKKTILQDAKKQPPKPVSLEAAQLLAGKKTSFQDNKSSTASPQQNVRKDSSPIKPLADIMDVSKLVRSPHTPEQISALWTAYHASRSSGTGRGYLSATIPLPVYEDMVGVAGKYSSFVLPLVRPAPADEGVNKQAYEFHFLQWSMHHSPPPPSPDPFPIPTPFDAPPITDLKNPPITTILFTPLQEYKLRQQFATPHLIITNYTDFARTHGIVLLRGEITPSSNGEGRFVLSQQDAQMLAMGVQRFYLTSRDQDVDARTKREALLRSFHEKPEDFKWEDLLVHANPVA